MKKRLGVVLTLATTVGAIGIAAPASAALPSGCRSMISGQTGIAWCTGGTGWVSARATCSYQSAPGTTPYFYTVYGPKVYGNPLSSAMKSY